MRTERLADQHYKRVSNFAKEMLVWPEEIEVHKIKNDKFISEMKPSNVMPPINNDRVDSSMDLSVNRGSPGAAANSKRFQPPMKFGSYQTGVERLAESIMKQNGLDVSPSKRTALGSDVKVLNLRPVDQSRMLGRPGHLRVKAQSSI